MCALRPGPRVCVSTALCEPCDGRAVGLAGQCASQTACGVRARAACAQATIHHKSTSARFLKEERKKKFSEERTASQVRLLAATPSRVSSAAAVLPARCVGLCGVATKCVLAKRFEACVTRERSRVFVFSFFGVSGVVCTASVWGPLLTCTPASQTERAMAAAERAAAVAVQRDIMGMAAAAVSQRRVYLTCARPLRPLLRSDVCYLLHWRAELPFAFCGGNLRVPLFSGDC